MRRILAIGFVLVLILSGCLGETTNPAEPDIDFLREYASQDTLDYTETENGIFYSIFDDKQGTDSIAENNIVAIHYELYLTDGTLIEKTNPLEQPKRYFNTAGSIQPAGLSILSSYATVGDKIKALIPGVWTYGFGNNFVLIIEYDTMLTQSEQISYEISQLAQYAGENSLRITDTVAAGVYLSIQEKGSGILPQNNDAIKVSYTGRFVNGEVFDEATDFSFILGSQTIIECWNLSFGVLSPGSKAVIYSISDFAYSNLPLYIPESVSRIGIPPYSPLIFEVEYLD